MYDAIAEALRRLETGNRDKKALIVISDGGDNASKHRLGGVLKLAEQSSALIYTIGIFDQDDPDRNPRALKHLAAATGGEAFFPARLDEVVGVCERNAREIRHQYTLGYVSSNPAASGAYRVIRVAARATGKNRLQMRTRAGYLAGEGSK